MRRSEVVALFDGAEVVARVLGVDRFGDPGVSSEITGTLQSIRPGDDVGGTGDYTGGWSLRLSDGSLFSVSAGAWRVLEREDGPPAIELVIGPSVWTVELGKGS